MNERLKHTLLLTTIPSGRDGLFYIIRYCFEKEESEQLLVVVLHVSLIAFGKSAHHHMIGFIAQGDDVFHTTSFRGYGIVNDEPH